MLAQSGGGNGPDHGARPQQKKAKRCQGSALVDAELLKFANGDTTHLSEAANTDTTGTQGAAADGHGALDTAVLELETRMLRDAMAQAGGNQSEAARRLGISRVGLIKKLSRLGLK